MKNVGSQSTIAAQTIMVMTASANVNMASKDQPRLRTVRRGSSKTTPKAWQSAEIQTHRLWTVTETLTSPRLAAPATTPDSPQNTTPQSNSSSPPDPPARK